MATNNFILKLGTEYLAKTASTVQPVTEGHADTKESASSDEVGLSRRPAQGRKKKLRVHILTDADPHGILIAHTYMKHIGSVCDVTWLSASLWKRRESLCLPSGSLLPLRPDEKRVATCALRRWHPDISSMMMKSNNNNNVTARPTTTTTGADVGSSIVARSTAIADSTSVSLSDGDAVLRMRVVLCKVMENMLESNEKFELEALSCCGQTQQTQTQMHSSSQGNNGGNPNIELGLFEHVSYLLRTYRHQR